ncbi:MAG: HNH endonuclease signature motif containing protein, partial [Actinomycetota bacterium]|nr:HNH endonuclease signature motif containing protein [Actinomycetota bacterium]
RRQIATADGSRSMSEWTAARLDVGLDTARSLVRTMRRLQDRPDLETDLATGSVTFDRVEALSRIQEDVGLMEWSDVAGVRREAAKRARITAEEEYRSAGNQFLVLQPTLDESWWKVWGGLDGPTGAIVDKSLTEKADQLPDLPDGSKGDLGWRKAMALAEVCVSGEAPPVQVTVFVDARQAAQTDGEAGVVLDAGANAGSQALEAVLCDSVTEVIARTEDGRYMDYGRKRRTVPPSLKRALLDKYQHRCGADGCDSRYRLEAHHLIAYSQGGATDQADLVLLCWFHHQIVIHQRGFEVYAHPEHGRIRFRRPERRSI